MIADSEELHGGMVQGADGNHLLGVPLVEQQVDEEAEKDESNDLQNVEEHLDFFEMEVRRLLKKQYPDDNVEEEISKSVEEPIENEKHFVEEFSLGDDVSLEVDESEYLPGTLEITGEMSTRKDDAEEEEKRSTENENSTEKMELDEEEDEEMTGRKRRRLSSSPLSHRHVKVARFNEVDVMKEEKETKLWLPLPTNNCCIQ